MQPVGIDSQCPVSDTRDQGEYLWGVDVEVEVEDSVKRVDFRSRSGLGFRLGDFEARIHLPDRPDEARLRG